MRLNDAFAILFLTFNSQLSVDKSFLDYITLNFVVPMTTRL